MTPAAPAAPAALQKAVEFIEAELAAGTFPGAALAVTQARSPLIERYWGAYCSREQRAIPYDGSVVNMLYSFSKGVSATIVVQAHQRGLLDYDLPLKRYIPEFGGGGKDEINLRQLLTHSAGIPSAPFGDVFTPGQWQAALKAVCAMRIEWEPGSKNLYHAATGMFLAAEAVLRLTGEKSWESLCRRWLFEPLGTENMSFDVPAIEKPLALTPLPKELPCPVDPAHFWALGAPGGGCFGTVADVLKILHLHLNGGVWEGRRLIEDAAFKEMHTIQNWRQAEQATALRQSGIEYWGLGWQMRGISTTGWFGFGSLAGGQSFGHAGIDTVMTVADPARDLAIVFLTTNSPQNSVENTPRIRNKITDLIVAAIIPE